MNKAEILVKDALDERIDQIANLVKKTMEFSEENILWAKADDGGNKKNRYGLRLTDNVKKAIIKDLVDELECLQELRDEIFSDSGED